MPFLLRYHPMRSVLAFAVLAISVRPSAAQLDPNAITSLGTLDVSPGTLSIDTDSQTLSVETDTMPFRLSQTNLERENYDVIHQPVAAV